VNQAPGLFIGTGCGQCLVNAAPRNFKTHELCAARAPYGLLSGHSRASLPPPTHQAHKAKAGPEEGQRSRERRDRRGVANPRTERKRKLARTRESRIDGKERGDET